MTVCGSLASIVTRADVVVVSGRAHVVDTPQGPGLLSPWFTCTVKGVPLAPNEEINVKLTVPEGIPKPVTRAVHQTTGSAAPCQAASPAVAGSLVVTWGLGVQTKDIVSPADSVTVVVVYHSLIGTPNRLVGLKIPDSLYAGGARYV